jgi:uroporphyrinogen-III synthase
VSGAAPLVLITRPAVDAAPLAHCLSARGYRTRVEPMLDIVWRDGPAPDVDGVQALLFTSANGVRAFARRSPCLDRPVLTVGHATASAAREAGFQTVDSAGGDVEALAALALGRCRADGGALLHVAGSAMAGDLAGRLGQAGFTVRREILYDARPAQALSAATVTDLAAQALSFVLFFSPRTARSFVSLARGAGLAEPCRTVVALCLSGAVAAEAGQAPWKDIRTATRPEQDSMLDLLPDRRSRSGSADSLERPP